ATISSTAPSPPMNDSNCLPGSARSPAERRREPGAALRSAGGEECQRALSGELCGRRLVGGQAGVGKQMAVTGIDQPLRRLGRLVQRSGGVVVTLAREERIGVLPVD